MTHYRMQYDMPSATVLAKNPRTSSLDELKIYNTDSIYLKNGDEFQIRLFNPLREKIGVQIGINGDLSKGLIVLNPGEDVTLDRFIDNNSKMLFEIYNYDASNPVASNAVAENGIIDVRFFKEKEQTIDYSLNGTLTTSDTSNIYLTSDMMGTTNIQHTLDIDSTYTTSSTYTTTSASMDFMDMDLARGGEKSITETGRVEKGDNSKQSFNSVETEFENQSFHNIIYNIKPVSEKKITNNIDTDIRDYCTGCGYRLRNNRWSFCPKCGIKI